MTQKGRLEGPVCGYCDARYLDAPDEFIFNGTHGKIAPTRRGKRPKPSGFRIIHKPCKGKPGARISVSLNHQAQKKKSDNVRLLRELVNGASINDLQRPLSDPDTGKKCGVSCIYSRISFLEKILLAFERAKLQEWKAKEDASDRFSHMRIAHDDVVISVNWESRFDRRLTPLHCSVSADIRSGYVFRIDGNFDPCVDLAAFFEEHYLDDAGQPHNIRKQYTQKSGKVINAPLLQFQRPSGRFDEAAFFASAESSWRVFEEKLKKAYEDDISCGIGLPDDVQQGILKSGTRRRIINEVRNGYFGLVDADRDHRGSFKGAVVKLTYTKAAHLACLRKMLPASKITLVGKQEATMVRAVPHIFRDLIKEDMFEWFVMSFDKEASTPTNQSRIRKFEKAFEEFSEIEIRMAGEEIPRWELLRRFCAAGLTPAVKSDSQNGAQPFSFANFQSAQFPKFWASSPVQHYGETEKTVGFPVLRSKYRKQLRSVGFDQNIQDDDLRRALARRVQNTTIQPVSAFMNSVRSRISPTARWWAGQSKRSQLHQWYGIQSCCLGRSAKYLTRVLQLIRDTTVCCVRVIGKKHIRGVPRCLDGAGSVIIQIRESPETAHLRTSDADTGYATGGRQPE